MNTLEKLCFLHNMEKLYNLCGFLWGNIINLIIRTDSMDIVWRMFRDSVESDGRISVLLDCLQIVWRVTLLWRFHSNISMEIVW